MTAQRTPPTAQISILVVDDDRSFSSVVAAALGREGFPVSVAHSLHEARGLLQKGTHELVLLDRRLPDGDGLSFLPELKSASPACHVVMVTAHGDIASAVDSIHAGAADYVAKPIELADLVMKARRAVEQIRLKDRLDRVETELSGRRRLIPPTSAAMKRVVEMLERVAQVPRSPVLLLGETGVGKEVLAWHVHATGATPSAPFIHVNCAALPESTAESELFGNERGAFTDARASRRGLVEVASGGTLFLDEVGELSAAIQAKLLTFLDSGAFRRLGGTAELSSTARIVAATNRNLEADIRAGAFREDLWFRLSVFAVQVPPLRERKDDLRALAQGIIEEIRVRVGRKSAFLGERAWARLDAYAFPGNVRELRNILERAVVLEPGPELTLDLLSPSASPPAAAVPRFTVEGDLLTAEEVDRRYARWVLERLDGRRMDAAKALGLSYPTFLKRLEE